MVSPEPVDWHIFSLPKSAQKPVQCARDDITPTNHNITSHCFASGKNITNSSLKLLSPRAEKRPSE